MGNRLQGAVYFHSLAILLALATGLGATWATSMIVIPKIRDFSQRAYGLEPPIKIADITADQVTRPWRSTNPVGEAPEFTSQELTDLYPPQPGSPIPNRSARANDLSVNLFYALMYYGQPPEAYQGKRLTYEYDSETGYGRVISEPYEEAHLDFVSYHAALEMHHQLHPEIALFDAERLRMRELAPRLMETAPSSDQIMSTPRAPTDDIYWLSRQLAQWTEEPAYDAFADSYGAGMVRMGLNYANLIELGRPYTIYASHFNLPAIMQDMAERTNSPELRRKAAELMARCIDELYDPQTKTIRNDYGSISGTGSDTREASDLFDAIEGMWKYYELSGDSGAQRLAMTLSSSLAPTTSDPSPMLNNYLDVYRLYATLNEQGTLLDGNRISSLLDLRALKAVQLLNEHTNFGPHDQDFALLLQAFQQKFYDEIHNGFYMDYTFEDGPSQEYTPVPVGSHKLLSIRIAARLTELIQHDQYARAHPATVPVTPTPETSMVNE